MKSIPIIARIMVLLVLLSAANACGPAGQPDSEVAGPEETRTVSPEVPAELLDRAREASGSLMAALKKELASAISSGGPSSAIVVCNTVAPAIAAEHSVDGLSIKRVSLKNRNSGNAPDPYERERLLEFDEKLQAGSLPDELYEIVDDEGGPVFRYMQPITVQGICLKCHGDQAAMDQQVLNMIQEKYPEDKATGYAAGDLRGAISVRIDLDMAE